MIYFFDLSSGVEVRRIQAPFAPAHLRFDPAERKLAICVDSRRDLLVLDAASGTVIRSFDAGPTGCAWSYDGSLLASTCFDSQVRLWDIGSGLPRATLKGHTAPAMTVVGSPTSDLLASSGWDGKTRFWDTVLEEQLFSLPGALIWFSPPSPDDRRLGFHVADQHAGIWELAPACECKRWRAGGIGCASFDASGHVLATGGPQGIAFWDVERRRLLEEVPTGECWAMGWAADGKSLFSAAARGVERWTIEFDPVAHRLLLGTAESLWRERVTLAGLSPSGYAVVGGQGTESNLVVLDLRHPDKPRIVAALAQEGVVSMSQDGKRFVMGRWHGRDVTVWNVATGQPEKVLPAAEPARGEFSPDGQYLMVGSSKDYQVFKTDSWERVFRLPRESVEGGTGAIQFSPDNSLVAVQLEQLGHIHLLATGSWQELAAIEEGSPLCFSADGTKLAVYSAEAKLLMIWDLRQVRRQLAAIRLDWDAPPLPPWKEARVLAAPQ